MGESAFAVSMLVQALSHIVKTGNSPEFYSVDPRSNSGSVLSLSSISGTSGTLPLDVSNPASIPQFVVPPFSTDLELTVEEELSGRLAITNASETLSSQLSQKVS